MPTLRAAGVDVGSNSFLLAIVERQDGADRLLLDRTDITKLGEGVDRTQRLSPAAVERGVAKLREYRAICDEYAVTAVRAAGTAALRDAVDRAVFVDRVERECGWRIEVVTGEREAELTYADVARTHGEAGTVLNLLDIGGGSTEVVSGRAGQISARASVNIGSRRLHERVQPGDPWSANDLARARAVADETLAPLTAPDGVLAGSGGTITTLAALHLRLHEYESERINAVRLSREQVTAQVAQLTGLTCAARRELPGLEPDRADIIATGAVLVERALQRLGADELRVCSGGLRLALARWALDDADA